MSSAPLTPEAAGRALARFHHDTSTEGVEEHRLTNLSETPRLDGWSLRAGLVRYAQPYPLRSSAILNLVRRLDAALHSHARALERDAVVNCRDLGPDSFGTSGLVVATDPVVDSAVSDIARLVVRWPGEASAIVDGYRSVRTLDNALLEPLDFLTVAVELDMLADVITDWATTAEPPGPTTETDETCRAIHARMADVGIPEETMPEGGRSRRG